MVQVRVFDDAASSSAAATTAGCPHDDPLLARSMACFGLATADWELRCSACFARLGEIEGTRAEVLVYVEAEHWERRDRDVLWCVDCQRAFRNVKPRFKRLR